MRENEVERLMKKLEEEISKEGENTDRKIPWKVGRRKEATGRVSNIGNFTVGIYGRMFKKSTIDRWIEIRTVRPIQSLRVVKSNR